MPELQRPYLTPEPLMPGPLMDFQTASHFRPDTCCVRLSFYLDVRNGQKERRGQSLDFRASHTRSISSQKLLD